MTAAGGAPATRRPRLALRPTLRLRLTLLYGGLLLAVGVLLFGLSYGLLVQVFANAPKPRPGQLAEIVDSATGQRYLVDARAYFDALLGDARGDFVRRGLLVLGVVSAVGVAGGYLLAGSALRPLQQVTATARRLSTETLNQRIGRVGPDDELQELSDTFDGMLARLQAAFEAQQRFVANASHELRTPLAVIRTEVDVTLADPAADGAELRRMGEVVRDAADRANRLVDALLLLARTDAQGAEGLITREPVDLTAVVASALAAVQSEVDSHELSVSTDLQPAPVSGDAGLLERLVSNLVENAVRHNVPGGWITARCGRSGDRVLLSVASSGREVAEDEVRGLFEPFRRGGTARTAVRGAGLGLSIVRSVATAHGGQVVARPVPGGGLEVLVSLPALGDAPAG